MPSEAAPVPNHRQRLLCADRLIVCQPESAGEMIFEPLVPGENVMSAVRLFLLCPLMGGL